VREVSKV